MKSTLTTAALLLGAAFSAQAASESILTEVYRIRANGDLFAWQSSHLTMSDFLVTTSDGKSTDVDKDAALLAYSTNEQDIGQRYDSLCPHVNLDSEEASWWTLSYTVTNSSEDIVRVTSLVLDMYAMHGTHDATPEPIKDDVIATLLPGYEYHNQTGSFTETNITLKGTGDYGVSDGSTTLLLPTGFILNPGENLTIYMTVSAPHNEGSDYTNLYVGLKGFEFSGYFVSSSNVPEPATATLSLLVLAGLATRRRRK